MRKTGIVTDEITTKAEFNKQAPWKERKKQNFYQKFE